MGWGLHRPSSALRMGGTPGLGLSEPLGTQQVGAPISQAGMMEEGLLLCPALPSCSCSPPLPSADPYSQHTTVLLGGEAGREDGP